MYRTEASTFVNPPPRNFVFQLYKFPVAYVALYVQHSTQCEDCPTIVNLFTNHAHISCLQSTSPVRNRDINLLRQNVNWTSIWYSSGVNISRSSGVYQRGEVGKSIFQELGNGGKHFCEIWNGSSMDIHKRRSSPSMHIHSLAARSVGNILSSGLKNIICIFTTQA